MARLKEPRWPGWLEVPAAVPGAKCVFAPQRVLRSDADGRIHLLPLTAPPGPAEPASGRRLARSRCEVLLSRGRQAVERAYLAGDAWLIGENSAAAGTLAAALASGRYSPYVLLRRYGTAAQVVLVGATLAAAQLGIYWSARGAGAQLAAQLAAHVHPGVHDWLRPWPKLRCHGEMSR